MIYIYHFMCRLRPIELLKLQEKSDESADVEAVKKHVAFQESWSKQMVWTGLSDVVASHVGDGVSQRGSGEKTARDVRHLFT